MGRCKDSILMHTLRFFFQFVFVFLSIHKVFDCLLLRASITESSVTCFRMESVYRMWARERCDGFESKILDDLRRELHITLGTAKWQVTFASKALAEFSYSLGNLLNLRRWYFRSWKSLRGPLA